MVELKPCPFCGGKAKFVELDATPNEEPRGYVRCVEWCCEQSRKMNKTIAIEEWNWRAEDGK